MTVRKAYHLSLRGISVRPSVQSLAYFLVLGLIHRRQEQRHFFFCHAPISNICMMCGARSALPADGGSVLLRRQQQHRACGSAVHIGQRRDRFGGGSGEKVRVRRAGLHVAVVATAGKNQNTWSLTPRFCASEDTYFVLMPEKTKVLCNVFHTACTCIECFRICIFVRRNERTIDMLCRRCSMRVAILVWQINKCLQQAFCFLTGNSWEHRRAMCLCGNRPDVTPIGCCVVVYRRQRSETWCASWCRRAACPSSMEGETRLCFQCLTYTAVRMYQSTSNVFYV